MKGNGTPATWQETPAGQQVLEKLSDEKTLHAIERLLERIDTLEKAVADLSVLMQRGPGLVSMAADIADETYRKAETRGISIDERLHSGLALAEKITEPGRVEKIEQILELTDQLPGLTAMFIDWIDEGLRISMERGYDPRTLAVIAGKMNTAITKARQEPPDMPGGIFGLMRALKDPDRQKGLGFWLNVLKQFGATCDHEEC